MDKTRASGEELGRALERIAGENPELARGTRGMGLMRGIELRTNPAPVIRRLQEEGVLALKAGLTVVRLLPPYMIGSEDIGLIEEKLSGILQVLKESLLRRGGTPLRRG